MIIIVALLMRGILCFRRLSHGGVTPNSASYPAIAPHSNEVTFSGALLLKLSDDNNGEFFDSSGNGLTTTKFVNPNLANGVIDLNGETDYVLIDDSSVILNPSNDFSFGVWIRRTGPLEYADSCIAGFGNYGDGNAGGWTLRHKDNALHYEVRSSSTPDLASTFANYSTSTLFPINEWVHVAVTHGADGA